MFDHLGFVCANYCPVIVIVITPVAAFAAEAVCASCSSTAGLMGAQDSQGLGDGAWGPLCCLPGFSWSLACGVAVPSLSRRWEKARFLLRVLQKRSKQNPVQGDVMHDLGLGKWR